MKKMYLFLVCLCFVLFSCPYESMISDSSENISSNKQYDAISALGYIGGAVVYNPNNPSGSQLFSGAEIAVYLGKLTATTINADVYDPNVFNASASNWQNTNISSVELYDSQDIYGYLTIQSVSTKSISATYYSFSTDGKTKHSSSFTLNAGRERDLNGDGNPDIAYSPLVPVRDDFENAMCLEFISSKDKLYTTMYATITDDLIKRSARAAEPIRSFNEYKNTTFYGMNSEGSFIYITGGDDPSPLIRGVINYTSTDGISHGDYVIDQHTGEIFAVVGNVPETDSKEDTSSPFGDLSLKNSDDYENSSDNYDILVDDNYELEDFFTYLYRKNQFASDDGPVELLKKLPQKLLTRNITDLDNCTTDQALDELFQILTQGSVVEIIAEEKGIELTQEDKDNIQTVLFEYLEAIFPTAIYQQLIEVKDNPEEIQKIIDANWNNIKVNDSLIREAYLDLIAMNRLYIENNYPESPPAIVPVPELSTVYPLMSIKIGDIPTDLDQELPPEIKDSSRQVLASDQLNENFAAFLQKKKKIKEEFAEFYSINLSSISISDLKDNTNPKVEEKEVKKDDKKGDEEKLQSNTCHFELKIGVIGSFNSRWGYIKSDLASAVYMALDLNVKEFNQVIPLFNKKLFDKKATFMIGPVPLTVGFAGKIGMNITAQILNDVDMAMEYVGMYGGGVSFNANYGLHVKDKYGIPCVYGYFNPSINSYKIHQTSAYAGPVTNGKNPETSYGGRVILHPFLSLAPQIALGPKYAYAGIELPLEVYANSGYAMYSDNVINLEEMEKDNWHKKIHIEDNVNIWEKITIGTSISVSPVLGVKIPGVKKKLQTNWKAITLLRGELALQGDGSLKPSGGYLEW